MDNDLLKSASTPIYYYDADLLRRTLEALTTAAAIDHRFKVHYAVKANARPEILSIIQNTGLGADCVSEGEIKAAVNAGFPADKLYLPELVKLIKRLSSV